MSHDDFEFEPQPGLPAPLPPGERLLWQGHPQWPMLAIHAYHARKAALYFAFLVVWRVGNGIVDGHGFAAIASSCGVLILMGFAVISILSTLAYFSSRATVFSITSRRILIRHGVAVPMTLNIPFTVIASADLKLFGGTRGDIVLRLVEEQRVGYLITWPYLRPGHFAHPQPNLRALEQAAAAATHLREALQAFSCEPLPVSATTLTAASHPANAPATANAA